MNQSLRIIPSPTDPDFGPDGGGAAQQRGRLGALLLGAGQITPSALRLALVHQAESGAPLGMILCQNGDIDENTLYNTLAAQFGAIRIDPADYPVNTALIEQIGAQFCAVHGVLPIAKAGATAVVTTSDPGRFHMIRPILEQELGPVSMVVSSQSELYAALLTTRKRALARNAERRTKSTESCRTLSGKRLVWGGGGLCVLLCLALLIMPIVTLSALTVLALAILAINTVFAVSMAAIWLLRRGRITEPIAQTCRIVPVSVMVPLFREKHIAKCLIQRLSRLNYPPEQLEILLVVEEDDAITQATLAQCTLPATMRTLIVPRGQVQTKPRALNYALDFCRGHIVGVYDAEDAPDPDQIRAAVAQFQRAPPVVACLQGRLDYYNPRKNWMARCFTIEYATWFRIMLPGMAHLGLALPLGGTTLFFRKSALISLGGWDSHNVTEDADLGLRLARRGYRTDLLDSVTLEEANCHPWPWVRQRSRWIKGYAMTYFVHMRNPVTLYRDLGGRGFWGMQLLFLGSLLGVLTAPLLWAFVLILFGLPHPWTAQMSGSLGTVLSWSLGGAALIHWSVWILGAYAKGDRGLMAWAPTLSIYHALATAAALKAAFEIMTKPFFWDKTMHGHLSETPSPAKETLT
ncbi:glycosyltransferase family 2 protein [Oceaniglobus ichthyenteri]|uniref:glycosyltransferase family 2 protein n=1 Tax=Oceaniglobus ichthyenteri TaxID=2136177 RepID=UPI000D3831B5|nr:glycosyltransferase [Oceaniglobus ichthyenteri]